MNRLRNVVLSSVMIASSAFGLVGNALAAQLGGITIVKANVAKPTVSVGNNSVLLGSFDLGNSTSHWIAVNEIVLSDRNYANNGSALQSLGSAFTNIRLAAGRNGELSVSQTVQTNVNDPAGTQYRFVLPNNIGLPPGNYIERIFVYGDVRSSANWRTLHTLYINKVSGQTSNGIAYYNQNVQLQPIKFNNPGSINVSAGSLRITVDNSSPAERNLTMGTTGRTLAAWKLSADNVESIMVSRFDAVNITSIGSRNVRNLSLWVNGARVSSVLPSLDVNNRVRFEGLNLIVPRNGSVVISLQADMATANQGATINAPVVMQASVYGTISGAFIDPIVARGTNSNAYPQVFGPAVFTANAQYAN